MVGRGGDVQVEDFWVGRGAWCGSMCDIWVILPGAG